MRRILKSRLALAIAVGVTVATVGGGVAWALQPPVDGSGVVHGCFNPSTGALKLDVVGHCPSTGMNRPITWNQQGVAGAPGGTGLQGPVGPQGPAGATVNTCTSPPGPNLNFSFCDLSGGRFLVDAEFAHSLLIGTNFDSDLMIGADLSNTDLRASALHNAQLTQANLGGANLTGADARSVHLQFANLFGDNLSYANLTGADAANADLRYVDFTNANLTTATFTGAKVIGVTWSFTTCPDGTNSDNDGGTCLGHGGGL